MLMVVFSDLTIGQIFAVFGYLWFMLSPVQELLGIQFSWYAAKAALKRINSLLELEEEYRPISKVNPFTQLGEVDIEINNIHFSYDGESQVLNDLSLHIPAGKKGGVSRSQWRREIDADSALNWRLSRAKWRNPL